MKKRVNQRIIDKHFLEEIEAVEKFLKNQNKSFNKELIDKNTEEPTDISYSNVKYQIVSADFKFKKSINKEKRHSSNRNPEKVFNDFVLEPLQKKNKYDKDSIKDIILIINAITDPPKEFINKELQKRQPSFFQNFGFKNIYLVTRCQNIKIF